MTNRQLKVAMFMMWGGVALLLLGFVLVYPTLSSYLTVLLYTPQIPTAPPVTPAAVAQVVVPAPTVAVTPTATAEPYPTPTQTPIWTGVDPTRVRIPAIELDAPVVPIEWEEVNIGEGLQAMWKVPDWRAAGWHSTSAKLGVPGNTVLNGHNTTKGEVFRDLFKLEPGALILVESTDGATYAYRVQDKFILPEAGQPLEVRQENARFIQPTMDERITLVTCHPYGSLANRLLIIAFPEVKSETLPLEGE